MAARLRQYVFGGPRQNKLTWRAEIRYSSCMRIGFDIGGTNFRAGLVNNGRVIKTAHTATPIPMTNAAFIRAAETVIGGLGVNINQVESIGIAVAGLVMADRGVLLAAANLGTAANMEIARLCAEKFHAPTKIGNDVSCFALAAAAKCPNLVFLAIGTGVNAGVVSGGRILSGAGGTSIEYGHTFLAPTNEKCACGAVGCVEQFISGPAILKAAAAANLQINQATDLFALAKTNEIAKGVVDKFLGNLVTVLLNLCNTFRPQEIVLGGGVGKQLGPFLPKINRELSARNFGYPHAPAVVVRILEIDQGAILGSAML
jgi:glucokinase